MQSFRCFRVLHVTHAYPFSGQQASPTSPPPRTRPPAAESEPAPRMQEPTSITRWHVLHESCNSCTVWRGESEVGGDGWGMLTSPVAHAT